MDTAVGAPDVDRRDCYGPAEQRQLMAFDFETHLIAAGKIAPPPVCISQAMRDMDDPSKIAAGLSAVADPTFRDAVYSTIDDEGLELVGHNTPFDLSVMAAWDPNLFPWIFRALAGPPEKKFVWVREGLGRCHDTVIREKLLHLSTHGRLQSAENEDGTYSQLEYGLDKLEYNRLGRDRSAQKEDEDAWRHHYQQLEDKPSSLWPQEARTYPIEDAEGTLLVYESQEEDAEKLRANGIEPFATEKFQVAVAFALRLMTCRGLLVDEVEKQKLIEWVDQQLAPANFQNLYAMGVLRPAEPPRPHKNGAKNPDGTPKMTKGKEESRCFAKLHELIVQVCEANGLEVKYTEPSEKFPNGQVKADKEVMELIGHLHPALEEYKHRESFNKLKGTEIPRMGNLGIVYANFNVLVETGRTSSYAVDEYPSINGQNVHPRARLCYKPRDGYVFVSVDYSSLEFVSLAQVCYSLFGESVMRDLLLAGVDPHAYFAAEIAYRSDDWFRSWADESGAETTMARFELFKSLEEFPQDDTRRQFYEKFRKMAKPIDFGVPGGMGPDTLVSTAKKSYGVDITREQAEELRDLLFELFPEIRQMLKQWIPQFCQDPDNPDTYVYTSPFGMVRAGASFCAACNGVLLQTPAAEGAKLATFEVTRACYDPTYEDGEPSMLYGCYPLLFIHDELIVEVPEDEWLHERAHEIARLMVEAMKVVMPDVPVKAKPAAMRRWNKDAKGVYDKKGRLQVWEPKSA